LLLIGLLYACTAAPTADVRPVTAVQAYRAVHSKSDMVRVASLWAMWCGPCLTEVEALRTLGTEQAAVALINVDTPSEYDRRVAPWSLERDWVDASRYRLTERDPMNALSSSWPGWHGALPYTEIIAKDGSICERFTRAVSRTELLEAIERCSD